MSTFYNDNNNKAMKRKNNTNNQHDTAKGNDKKQKTKTNNNQDKMAWSWLQSKSLQSVVGSVSLKSPSSSLSSITPKKATRIETPVCCNVIKEIFLERFNKEIIQPFHYYIPKRRPKSKHNETNNNKNQEMKERNDNVLVNDKLSPCKKDPIALANKNNNNNNSIAATNDDNVCTNKRQLLTTRIKIGTNQCSRVLSKQHQNCALIVLAKDIYPPAMVSHIPVIAKQHGIPLLLLPGQASSDLGDAVGTKKTSVMVFLSSPPTQDQSKEQNNNNDKLHGKIDSFIRFVIQQIPVSDDRKGKQPHHKTC